MSKNYTLDQALVSVIKDLLLNYQQNLIYDGMFAKAREAEEVLGILCEATANQDGRTVNVILPPMPVAKLSVVETTEKAAGECDEQSQ